MNDWVEMLTGETQARLLSLLRRSHQTINGLASALGLTDNAVRLHISTLERDGLVTDVGLDRETGGKPARRYGLTRTGEELFPKAYALVLNGVIEEIVRSEGRARATAVLEAVGRRVGAATDAAGDIAARVEAARDALRALGADIDVERVAGGWKLQGYACPLAAVALENPEACALAQALVAAITGRPVTECCDRSDRARCAFLIKGEAA